MSKVLVTGITGHQGQSVFKALRLSGHEVIGLTRNVNSDKSKLLIEKGCHLVQGNLDDPQTLLNLPKCDMAFLVTDFWAGKEGEIRHGKNFIDAIECKCNHIVFSSTLTSEFENTFSHSDSKNEIEKYLKTKNMPFTILRLGFFMEIFSDPKYVPVVTIGMMKKIIANEAKLPFVCVEDIGRMVNCICSSQSEFISKEINLVSDYLSLNEINALYLKHRGRKLFTFSLPNFLFSKMVSHDLLVMWQWFNRHQKQYFGSEVFVNKVKPMKFENWMIQTI